MKGSDPMSAPIKRRPLLTALSLWFAMFLLYILAGGLSQQLQLASTQRTLLFGGLLSVVGLIIVAVQRSWRAVGLGAPTTWTFALPLLVLPVINLARGFHADLGLTATLAVASLLVGLNEELWFRGLILRALAPKGLNWAVWGSAVLFGLLHLLNGLAGQDLLVTLIQIAYAFVIGLCYALVRLKSGSIWPLILIHAATDLFAWTAQAGQIGSGSVSSLFDLILPAVVVLLFAGYSAYLWRSRKAEPVAPAA